MDETPYEEIEHTADWALRVRGASLESVFQTAAIGMLNYIGASAQSDATQERMIELEAPDAESLLVVWLEELLFLVESCGVTFTAFSISIDQTIREARLFALLQETSRTTMNKEIKGVTYHDLNIQKTNDHLEVTVVFDV